MVSSYSVGFLILSVSIQRDFISSEEFYISSQDFDISRFKLECSLSSVKVLSSTWDMAV